MAAISRSGPGQSRARQASPSGEATEKVIARDDEELDEREPIPRAPGAKNSTGCGGRSNPSSFYRDRSRSQSLEPEPPDEAAEG
jgi:hypothetical protein